MKPKVVCLCGPVKFESYFRMMSVREGLKGKVVLMPILGFKRCPTQDWEAIKHLHRQKIEMADEIFVMNVGGYTGDHTKEEVAYAISLGKKIRWYAEEVEPKNPSIGHVCPSCINAVFWAHRKALEQILDISNTSIATDATRRREMADAAFDCLSFFDLYYDGCLNYEKGTLKDHEVWLEGKGEHNG